MQRSLGTSKTLGLLGSYAPFYLAAGRVTHLSSEPQPTKLLGLRTSRAGVDNEGLGFLVVVARVKGVSTTYNCSPIKGIQ